jgi:hypothetical protein
VEAAVVELVRTHLMAARVVTQIRMAEGVQILRTFGFQTPISSELGKMGMSAPSLPVAKRQVVVAVEVLEHSRILAAAVEQDVQTMTHQVLAARWDRVEEP